MNKLLLMVAANYHNFILAEASSREEAEEVLAEMPEQLVVSESNGFDTDDYYVWKKERSNY